jgi:predicted transcriptional regulator
MIDFQRIRRDVLHELRHGPANHYAIAEAIDQPPFAVHGELKALRRERLVTERLSKTGHDWRLTDRGWELIYSGDQMELH